MKLQMTIVFAFIVGSLLLFQNCSPSFDEEGSPTSRYDNDDPGDSRFPLNDDGTTTEDNTLDEDDTDPENPDDDPTNPDDDDDNPVFGPKDLKVNVDQIIESPEDCERTCQEQQECSEQDNEADRTSCVRSCNRETGLCQPFEVPPDPYTLTEFTIPAGYKKAEIVLEHCTDRNDVLVIEGPFMAFKTLNSGAVWNARFGANVGRGPRCKGLDLLDIAVLKVRTSNDQGELQPEKQYIWKLPGALGQSLSMIKDLDWEGPVFAHVKKIEGLGAKLYKIYDNRAPNKQLSFIVEYVFWYDPKYVTTIDLYYKKKVGVTPESDEN